MAEQKDAQEYLNIYFDRLENSLKNTKQKYLVNAIFGGKTVSQMRCTECNKVKDRLEDFLNFSLDVKDIKNVEDALEQ